MICVLSPHVLPWDIPLSTLWKEGSRDTSMEFLHFNLCLPLSIPPLPSLYWLACPWPDVKLMRANPKHITCSTRAMSGDVINSYGTVSPGSQICKVVPPHKLQFQTRHIQHVGLRRFSMSFIRVPCVLNTRDPTYSHLALVREAFACIPSFVPHNSLFLTLLACLLEHCITHSVRYHWQSLLCSSSYVVPLP